MVVVPVHDIESSRFAAVCNYVEEHLAKEITVADLADLVCLSATRFAHRFRMAYGVAPYRYILLRRIARAKTLLRTTRSTIAVIATEVGFSSQSRFTDTFMRLVGMAPSLYRTLSVPGQLHIGELENSRLPRQIFPQLV